MNYRKITTLFFNLAWALVLAITALPAQAAVPQTLNYQGQLASAAGVPVNGTVSMVFKLYDVASGGVALWSETQDVVVSNGLYSVTLGGNPTALTSTLFGVPLYLGITVGADAEMTQRIALSSSATALRASLADALAPTATVAGSQVTGSLSNVTISGATLIDSQLSGTAMLCDTAHQGALRWVAATGTFEGCTGNAWMTIIQEPLFRVAAVDAGGSHTSIKIGTDGLPMISYYSGGALKVAHCGNAACMVANTLSTLDDTAGGVGQYSSLAIGADGLPVISYLDPTNYDLRVAHCGNAACSANNTITAVDTVGWVGGYTSIAIGADGLPVISYYDYTNADLKVAKCTNAACTASTLSTVDSTGNVGAYTSIAVGADGLPVISYQDVTNVYLKVAKCGDASCSSGNTTSILEYNRAGYYTSIAMGADGLPVISYQQFAQGQLAPGYLMVAKCVNATCAAWTSTITSLDGGTNVGAYSSIAIRADGLPVISYVGVDGLRMAKCVNAACTGSSTISTVDTGGGGGYTAIAIGIDGLPLISYTGLKVAKCTRVQGACL